MTTQFKCLLVLWLLCTDLTISTSAQNVRWTVLLEQKSKEPIPILTFSDNTKLPLQFSKSVDNMLVTVGLNRNNKLIEVHADISTETSANAYITLQAKYESGDLYSYSGKEIKSKLFRQSPHNPTNHRFPNLQVQDIPMLAIANKGQASIAISNSPAFFDNYTTQFFDPSNKRVSLSGGDNGKDLSMLPPDAKIEEHYPTIGPKAPHNFDAIVFDANFQNLSNLRSNVLKAITLRWGEKKPINRFYATSFGSNYMLLRKNEKLNSEYWVVPGIIYANKQYSRDAFWQSMVLPAKYAEECYKNEAIDQTPGAERPLFALIWAYRVLKDGGKPNIPAAQKSLDYIQAHVRNDKYYSLNDPAKKNFQSWYDLVAFEGDDVLTYNQGLLAVALLSAQKLGLMVSVDAEKAIENYKNMFNKAGGYYPLSTKKDLVAVDAFVGDLLAQMLFDRKLLPDSDVQQAYKTIVSKLKTPHGFKITAMADGNYAPASAYNIPEFEVDAGEGEGPGGYQWGGSWYLYDMIFLINAYLHNVPGAIDEIKWRGALDFKLGGVYHEYIHTITGKPRKANQGWNSAVYAIWQDLIDKGKANGTLFKAIDKAK